MADNTQIVGGAGDVIRDVAKTVNSPAKTPVGLLDVGGGAAGDPELVVKDGTRSLPCFVTDGTTPTQRQAVDAGGSAAVKLPTRTTGGATPYHLVSAGGTNATSVKAGAGTVYGVQAFNQNAAPRFLKLYDKASAPAVGTDVPVCVILLPGNANGAGAAPPFPVMGKAFALGIALAITGGISDSDATGVGLNDVVANLDYA